MKVLIITNYNYGHFLAECLDSVVGQGVPFDKVIFVDDGSTDGSVSIVNKYADKLQGLVVVNKQNGGQLSCLNRAVSYIEDDDIVFFLDSDDLYPRDYLERVVNHFDSDTDFVFCFAHYYRPGIDEPLQRSEVSRKAAQMLPCSSSITRFSWAWIGNPTSTVSMRGWVLKRIVPYADEGNWRTRADDLLVWGASLVGASKKYVPSIGISYRVHGDNNFFGKRTTRIANRNFNIEVFFNSVLQKNQLGSTVRMNCLLTELALADPRVFLLPNVPLSIRGLLPVAYLFAAFKWGKQIFLRVRSKWRIGCIW